MAETLMGNVITFLEKLGVYDVILPFLLVFTIVYAILDKTSVLGTEKIGKDEYWPRRNINAMVAFVIGFLVVASPKLVLITNEAMANVVILLLVSISYLMLMGVFYGTKEFTLEKSKELYVFMFINFLGIVLIFLHAIPTESGGNWLEEILDFLALNWQRDYVGAVFLIIIVVFFMHWIVGSAPETKEEKKT